MPAQKKRIPAKSATSAAKPAIKGLGKLPEWDLSALYQGIDDPAVKRDLDRADRYSIAFEEDFKGKLAALADGPDAGRKIAEAVKRFEQLDDLGRFRARADEDEGAHVATALASLRHVGAEDAAYHDEEDELSHGRVEGLDVLERIEGPVIFAANHASHLDTPLILLSLPDEWRRPGAVMCLAVASLVTLLAIGQLAQRRYRRDDPLGQSSLAGRGLRRRQRRVTKR